MISTTSAPQAQAPAKSTPKPTERFPILSRHWPEFPERAHRPVLTLISDRFLPLIDDDVDETIEHLAWDAYVAAVDAHDHHRTASTQRSRTTALLAWQHVFFLDEHREVWS